MAQTIVFDIQIGELYDGDYDNYSGRGMYGKQTTAVTVEESYQIKEIDEGVSIQAERESDYDYYEGKTDEEILSELIFHGKYREGEINNFRTDSLGMGCIIY
jgi:hypothetical protein